MPAEWQPHEACWMAWPCQPRTWRLARGDGLTAARRAYAEVAQAIGRFEPVRLLARDEDVAQAREWCGPSVEVIAWPIDDSWTRDTGPTFVSDGDGDIAGVDWRFNKYGNKFGDDPQSFANDVALASRLLNHLDVEAIEAPIVLEGGAIHVDGEGTVLVTEQCLLNPNRNPQLDRPAIEEHLRRFLGVRKVIWLGDGLVDDETDGHVDTIACFVAPGRVVALTSKDPVDANYAALRDNLARLRSARDAAGRSLEVIEIEQPAERVLDGERLPLSYVNFYIANDGIVMPACEDPPRDRAARETLTQLFPDRKVVQLAAMDIFVGGGGIHCITQQQPRGGQALKDENSSLGA